MTNKVMQSQVWYGDKCFFVSTLNRESSAALAYGATYAETMAWDCDPETGARGVMVGMSDSPTGSIRGHIAACTRLHETGEFDRQETEL